MATFITITTNGASSNYTLATGGRGATGPAGPDANITNATVNAAIAGNPAATRAELGLGGAALSDPSDYAPAPILRTEIPYNRDNAPVVITGTDLTYDGTNPSTLPVNPLPRSAPGIWEGELWFYTESIPDISDAFLTGPDGESWFGETPGGPVEDVTWVPAGANTGTPLVTPQITAGTPGQFCIVDDGANPPRFFVNAAIVPGDPEWTELPRPGYVHATHASGALELDATNAGTSRITTSTGASAFAITITLDLPYDPNNAHVWIHCQAGAGVGTVGTSGVTVSFASGAGLKTPGQNKTMILRQTGFNAFLLSGGAA